MVLIIRPGQSNLAVGNPGLRLIDMGIAETVAHIYDTFTGANGTSLTAHTIDINTPGNPWVLRNSSTMVIQSNKLVPSGSEPSSPLYWIATIDWGNANSIVSMVANPAGNNANCGVLVRYNTSDNTHYLVTHISSLNLFAILEYTGGVYPQRAGATVSIPLGTDRTILVTTNGTSITATINGGNQISYGSASANSSSTVVGLRVYDDITIGDSTVDNFDVTAP